MCIRGILHLTSDTTKWLVWCPKCTVYDSVVLRCNNRISIRHPLLIISNIISGLNSYSIGQSDTPFNKINEKGQLLTGSFVMF